MRPNSASSSRSGGRTPRRMPEEAEGRMHIGLEEDIEDWLEGAPKSTRGRTRRAVRRHAQGSTPQRNSDPRSGDYGDAPIKAAGGPKVKTRRKARAVQAARVRPPGDHDEEAAGSKRRPFWFYLRRVCLLLCLVLLAEGGVALLSAPQCAISEVQVQGAKETPAADLDTICASLVGQNFLRADRKTAVARAEKIPTVASAALARDWTAWPPRMVLTVQEREPFARVGGGNNWWVVDIKGMPFRPARAEDDKLYAVTGPTLEPQAGKALDSKAWKPVVEFAGLLNRDAARGSGWNLRRVYFDRHGFASLRLTGGQSDETLVQLGADGWPEKLRSARWALNDMAASGRHAQSINLISSSVATWTPRAGTGEEETAAPAESPQGSSPQDSSPQDGTQVAPATSDTPGSSPA